MCQRPLISKSPRHIYFRTTSPSQHLSHQRSSLDAQLSCSLLCPPLRAGDSIYSDFGPGTNLFKGHKITLFESLYFEPPPSVSTLPHDLRRLQVSPKQAFVPRLSRASLLRRSTDRQRSLHRVCEDLQCFPHVDCMVCVATERVTAGISGGSGPSPDDETLGKEKAEAGRGLKVHSMGCPSLLMIAICSAVGILTPFGMRHASGCWGWQKEIAESGANWDGNR